jgi:hypothetical protein
MVYLDNNKNTNPQGGSLKEFILNNDQNKKLIIFSIIAIIIQIIIYKLFYPYASFIFGDSYCYIDEANRNVQIDTYPIGYPMFLRIFSAFTISDTALVVFQYLLLQAGALALIFTIFYIHNPGKLIKLFLILITVFNPLFLHLSNTVSSDNFFFSLSLIWFTLLIWLVIKPTTRVVISHALILFIVFTVRYNALYYPLIAVASLPLIKNQFKLKIFSVVLGLTLIALFIKYNRDKYYELCHIRQFTPFSGWLMANNALYAYRYVPDSLRKRPPVHLIKLDYAVRTYFDTTLNNPRHPREKIEAYHDYMWQSSSPISTYWRNEFLNKEKNNTKESWAAAGALFNDYGKWIIFHYPQKFLQHVIFPNSKRWLAPPIEYLEHYNSGIETFPENVKKWFDYKSNFIKTNITTPQLLESIYKLYPPWAGVMNLIFFVCLLLIAFRKKCTENLLIKKIILIVFFLWVTNFSFSVFASPIALRYQMFPIQITTIFSFLLIDLVTKNNQNKNKKNI